MLEKVQKIDISRIAIVVLTIKVTLSSSLVVPWNSIVDNLCIIFAMSACLKKMFEMIFQMKLYKTDSWTKKDMKVVEIILFLLCTCICIRQYDCLITVIAIFLLIDTGVDDCIETIYRIQGVLIGIHLLSAGILSSIGYADKFWIYTDERLRFNGGFLHPNVLAAYILSCIMMYVWKNNKKISKKNMAALSGVMLLSYLITKSRTSFILTFLFLVLCVWGKKRRMIAEQIIEKLTRSLFPIICIGMLMIQVCYSNESVWILALDKILSGRLKYAAYAYRRSGIAIFPRFLDYAESRVIEWEAQWNLTTFTFDNVYSFLWMQLGILWIVLLSVIIYALSKRLDYISNVCILVWILFSVTEVHGLNCFKFFPLMLCVYLFSKSERKMIKDERAFN